MKVRVNVELEATDTELRDLAVDVAHRTGAKLIGTVISTVGPSIPGLSASLMDLIRTLGEAAAGGPAASSGADQAPPGAPPPPPPPAPAPAPAPAPEPPEPMPDFSAMTCGDKLPGDTVQGVMWNKVVKDAEGNEHLQPCDATIGYIVTSPQFGNRGFVRRVCCEQHMNHLAGSGMPCVVARIP